MLVHPLLVNYYKQMGMRQASDVSGEKLIELIILKKDEVLSHKLNYLKIHSLEFRLNGKLYDIVREVDKDSLIYLYCINDKKEEQLEKEFGKKTEDNASNRAQEPDSLSQYSPLLSEAICYLNLERMNAGHSEIKIFNKAILAQYWGDIPTPPPRFLSAL